MQIIAYAHLAAKIPKIHVPVRVEARSLFRRPGCGQLVGDPPGGAGEVGLGGRGGDGMEEEGGDGDSDEEE